MSVEMNLSARIDSADHQVHHAVADQLLGWYQHAARTLPWRSPPRSAERPDPYRVWLSEVMLQQTTVAAVIPYFIRFTERWPTVAALAAAPEADVLAAWAGLGYYSRARNLVACARMIVANHGGQFPTDVAQLRALPGVGDYTSAAIAAIAFGRAAVPVDANIERVIARLFAIETPLPAARTAIRAAAQSIWPDASRGGDFAQALMDLGSRICTTRNPACAHCPISTACVARSAGIAEQLPVKAARKIRPERHGRAWWIERDGAVWLVRRPPRGLLGGMRALPGPAWTDTQGVDVSGGQFSYGSVRHIFTHFALTLALDHHDVTASVLNDHAGEWWPIATLDAAGLPTLYQRAAALRLAQA